MRYGTQDLNLGFGARGGFTLPIGIYVGGVFDYFLGTSQTQSMPGASTTAEASMWDVGGEAGYDFGFRDSVVVRPYLGFGMASAQAKVCIDDGTGSPVCMTGSSSKAFISFGGQVNYMAGSFYAGGDLRVMVVDDSAFILGGHVGLVF